LADPQIDPSLPVPCEVSQHKDLEYNKRISGMNEKEIGEAFNYSGMRISGKPVPDI
jgi:hypothetical protein